MLLNLEDCRAEARRQLPRFVFELIDGGAGDELTLRANTGAFASIGLAPRLLVDAAQRRLDTEILGVPVSMPIMLDPTAHATLAHPDGELAVARAAARAGILYALSTLSSYAPEQVAAATSAPKWFQLYAPADRGELASLIERVGDAGYRALCLTVDVPIVGLRERASRSHLRYPIGPSWRLAAQAAGRPRWARRQLNAHRAELPDLIRQMTRSAGPRPQPSPSPTARFITAADVAFIRECWRGPLVVKGVLRGEDADQLIELGADGLVVSNHGGRQLDGVPASVEALSEVVDAVAGRAEVFLDGGIRRGTDVIKALALGARAVLIGRPYLYGLAVDGEAGVLAVIETLSAELDNALALLGVTDVGELDGSHIRRVQLATRHQA